MTKRIRDNDFERDMGTRIRVARVFRGMQQAELARRIGVTRHQLQKYEYGANRVSVSTLYAIADALKCDVSALLPAAATVSHDPDAHTVASLFVQIPPDRRWHIIREMQRAAR